MAACVTVTERLFIAASPEEVWKFTQSEMGRPLWKGYCASPKILESWRGRLVHFEGCSTLKGRWTYEAKDSGCVWSQTNTLVLTGIFELIFLPLMRYRLRRSTRASMRQVKEALEFSEDLSGSLHEDFF